MTVLHPRSRCRDLTRSALPLTILLLGLLLAGCRGSTPDGGAELNLELHISPTPPALGPALLLVEATNAAGEPVTDAVVVVVGNMSHAGMAPVTDTADMQEPGRYAVSDFRFTMAGDWVLTVRATLSDGRWTEIDHPTRVVGGGGGGS